MNIMHRILLSLALAAAALLALGIGEASALPNLNEQFDYGPGFLAKLPFGPDLPDEPWYYGEDNPGFTIVASILGKTNVLKITNKVPGGYSSGGTIRDNFYPLEMGVIYFDFDIAWDDTADIARKMFFRKYQSVSGADSLFEIWLHGDDKQGAMGNLHVNWHADPTGDLIQNMAANQWYHITLAIDMDNNLLNAYVDDPTRSGAPVLVDYPINDRTFGSFGYNTYDGAASAVYFDNYTGQMQCFMTVEPIQRDLVPLDLITEPLPTPPHETVFTLTNVGLDSPLTYTVEEVNSAGQSHDYAWLSLDKTSGGPLASGSSDTVTATIDDSLSPAGPVGYLKFSNSCGYSEIRQLDVITDRILVWYMADVAPDAPDSHGVGQTFLLDQGVKQGQLAFDGAAIDCRAWHIVDSALEKTKWQSNDETSNVNIGSSTGATILGRVRVVDAQGTTGSNVAIYESFKSVGVHWGGPNGLLKETYRGDSTTLTGDADYHILRATVIGSAPVIVNLYFDENPTPVLTINPAANAVSFPDSFGFGTESVVGSQEIYFDWVTASNDGAFAPGTPNEEVAVLGHSLVPTYSLPDCDALVTPLGDQTSHALINQAADPPTISYTIGNAGTNDLNYTVVKDPAVGTDWLSLNTSGDLLASRESDIVTGTIDTTGLSPGVYTVDLVFSDDCVSTTDSRRTITLTVDDWTVTPNPGFDLNSCPQDSENVVFTITNHHPTATITYNATITVGDLWMTLDVSSVELGPGETGYVTADVNNTNPGGDNFTYQLAFENGTTLEVKTRRVSIKRNDGEIIMTYHGDMNPSASGSFSGTWPSGAISTEFALLSGSVLQGTVVDDLMAIDGKAWEITDTAGQQTQWFAEIDEWTWKTFFGATIVSRVSVISAAGNQGGNLMLEVPGGDGLAASYHYGGPTQGRVREMMRSVEDLDPERANSRYHTLRMAVEGGEDINPQGRIVRLYFDEDPTPVIEMLHANPMASEALGVGFGTSDTAGTQTIRFDYIRFTNSAFAPGEEEYCLDGNEQLDLPVPPWLDCNNPFADTDGDGDVDQDDFSVYQLCYTDTDNGPISTTPAYCRCLDWGDDDSDQIPDYDDDIDSFDFTAFQNCASGPNVPADPCCDGGDNGPEVCP
ncbi:MAG: BACON domain-containing protein [Planctomycetota bacterium]|jgi:hypothetical protein